MREELLLKYLAELQRHEMNYGEFNDRIHRVCDEIEKELGIRVMPCSGQTQVSPSVTGSGSSITSSPNEGIGDLPVKIDSSAITRSIEKQMSKLRRRMRKL